MFFLAPMGSDGPDFVTLYLFFTNKYEKKTIIKFFKKKTCFVHNKGTAKDNESLIQKKCWMRVAIPHTAKVF